MNLNTSGRILYVSMVDVSQPDGPGVNEREFMVSLLRKFGERVHVLAPTPWAACPDINVRQTTFYRNSSKRSPLKFLLRQLDLKSKVQRLVNVKLPAEQSFDLVVVRVGVLPLGFYLARRMHVPYAVKTFGAIQEFTRNTGLKGLVCKSLGGLNLFLFRGIIDRALAVDTCTSLSFQSHEKEFGLSPDRLLFQENAANVQRFRPQETSKCRSALEIGHFNPVLGFVGGYPVDRGGMEMLEVATRLLGRYPQLGVVIVGGIGADRLRRRAKELGIEDRAVIPGQVPYDEIPRYVNSFDVCFALDRPDRFRRVGNSYQKVRQYLACGKPVITCVSDDSALLRENLVESVDADNPDAIEAATRRLLGQTDTTRLHHAQRAVAYARKHLSTEAALNRRVDFWNERLFKNKEGLGARDQRLKYLGYP